jgi:cysteine desulfurase
MEAELEHCFNPASPHAFGRGAHRCLETARDGLAGLLECDRTELYFTAGGTPSNNLAILGFARRHRGESPRIFLTAVEHKAGLKAAQVAEGEGARVAHIPVDGDGTADPDWLAGALEEAGGAPALVSVMWANNEVGTIQPVRAFAELAHSHGARFHTDAVQAVGKAAVSLAEVPADFLTATAHKLGGPVGIGLLYCRRGHRLEPLLYGGEQERSVWPGTQNPLLATGFAEAARLAIEGREERAAGWQQLRDHLEARLLEEVPGAVIHGGGAPERLPNVVSVGIPDCDSGAVRVSLDLEGIAVSGGSACSSETEVGSTVLEAMGVEGGDRYATVRFSFGPGTTVEEVDRAAETLARVATRVLALGV